MCVRALRPMGIQEELLGQLFQRTLIGAALRYFLNVEPSKVKTSDDIANILVAQYAYNNLM